MLMAVYGTLRKGFGNYENYIKPAINSGKAKFIGKGKTEKKYTMHCAGIPFVIENEQTVNIVVEVYEINDYKVIDDIDKLEGHPDWYERREVPIILDNGKKIKAWMYFYTSYESMSERMRKLDSYLLESGDYEDYWMEGWYDE